MFLKLILIVNLILNNHNYTVPEKEPCHPEFPFMGVGDFNISKANFDGYLNKNDLVLLVISSSSCKECCQFEETFDRMNKFVFKNHTLHNLDYKMARMNLLTNLWIKADINFNHIPFVTLYHKKKHYYLTDTKNPFRIHNQVKRIINPYILITTLEEFDNFIIQNYDTKKYYKRIVRKLCIALFSDLEYYEDKYTTFLEVADTLSWREDLRCALVKDFKLIKIIYEKYRSEYFDDEELSGLILVSKKNDFEKKDKIYKTNFDNLKETILNYFVEKSIEPVEEITSYNSQVIHSNGKAIIYAFLDEDNNFNSEVFIDEYKSLQYMFKFKANFVWLSYKKNQPKAKQLGLFTCKNYPCIVIEQFKPENRNYLYPMFEERNLDSMSKFFNNYFNKGLNEMYEINSDTQKKNIEKIKKSLGYLEDINYYFFIQNILTDNINYLIYFVNLNEDIISKKSIKMLNTIYLFFKKVKNSNLKVAIYNLGNEKSLKEYNLHNEDILNSIIYLPNYNKKYPYKFFNNDVKGYDIVKFILIENENLMLSKSIEITQDEKQEGITIYKLFEGDEEL